MEIERREYPRPQFRRENWQSLNGEWEFAFDDKNDGIKGGLWQGKKALPLKIRVPFSYQYPASGIGDTSQHDIARRREPGQARAALFQRRRLPNGCMVKRRAYPHAYGRLYAIFGRYNRVSEKG